MLRVDHAPVAVPPGAVTLQTAGRRALPSRSPAGDRWRHRGSGTRWPGLLSLFSIHLPRVLEPLLLGASSCSRGYSRELIKKLLAQAWNLRRHSPPAEGMLNVSAPAEALERTPHPVLGEASASFFRSADQQALGPCPQGCLVTCGLDPQTLAVTELASEGGCQGREGFPRGVRQGWLGSGTCPVGLPGG